MKITTFEQFENAIERLKFKNAIERLKTQSCSKAPRYGYRIKKDEPDPFHRVEYLYDAVGMTPAYMDFEKGEFNYGSWKNIWFVSDNKPCMLKSDGTVDYYLDPNDYSLKEDGTESDVANTDYDGNAMAQFPLVWVYRYEDDFYLYEIISPVQFDENYKAYAHTDATGNIKDYFYNSLFDTTVINGKLRSLAEQSKLIYPPIYAKIECAGANGNGWYIGSWSQRELIRTLLILISKSTDTQSIFGKGNIRKPITYGGNFNNYYLLATGTLADKGQFFGYNSTSTDRNDTNQQVKVFHVEGFWGDRLLCTEGLILNRGVLYVKMTPPYIEPASNTPQFTVEMLADYTVVENDLLLTTEMRNAVISDMSCSEFGMIPTAVNGSTSTYFCDGIFSAPSRYGYLCTGACVNDYTEIGGVFSFSLEYTTMQASYHLGSYLAYV